MDKIVLGLSGGVDSSVSAQLLKDGGWEVYGLYLDIGLDGGIEEAQKAADFSGIPLRVLDIKDELEKNVCVPFTRCYLRGETPNPCIMCNPSVKFRALLDYADELGSAHIATGHYARAENGALYKGLPANDQSYMLCRLTREQVSRLVLPLGGYEKAEVRAMAQAMGVPAAEKPDSMEICFIPDKDYIGWISRRAAVPPEGDFVFHGEKLGRHEGVHRYTVGQRRPGLYDGRKLYISAIDADKNEVELALWEELFKTKVRARDVNWLIDVPGGPVRGSVKVRHTKWEQPACTVTPLPGGGMLIETDEPVRAPARGQSAVVYEGDRVICGGYIV